MNRQTALITGASSGIGFEFAKIFARQGYNLVLVARDKNKLDQIKVELASEFNVNVRIISKDLVDQKAAKDIYDELSNGKIEINVLINNAGFGLYGSFLELDTQAQLDIINLNIYSLTYLTRLFLADMIKNKDGKILNVASTAAFQPGPLMAVYYASKAYVLFFSEAIRSETKGLGVIVTVLCPGATTTAYLAKQPALAKSKLLRISKSMSAAKVAQIGFDGLMNRKAVVIPGLINKFLVFGTRLLPRNMITAISKWTLEE